MTNTEDVNASAPPSGSALWRLVVSKNDIPGYDEWHSNRVKSLRLVRLKEKLRDARRVVKVLALKLQLAKEACR